MKKTDIIYLTVFTIILLLFILSILHAPLGITYPILVVKSGSMEPVLQVGDIIIITPVDPNEIYASPWDGDIIVFFRPGHKGRGDAIIVHRAIERVEGGFVTKGDANAVADYFSPVPPDHIIGRWTGFKIPSWTGLGHISLFLRGENGPPIGPVLIGILIVINLILIIRDITRKQKEPSSTT